MRYCSRSQHSLMIDLFPAQLSQNSDCFSFWPASGTLSLKNLHFLWPLHYSFHLGNYSYSLSFNFNLNLMNFVHFEICFEIALFELRSHPIFLSLIENHLRFKWHSKISFRFTVNFRLAANFTWRYLDMLDYFVD